IRLQGFGSTWYGLAFVDSDVNIDISWFRPNSANKKWQVHSEAGPEQEALVPSELRSESDLEDGSLLEVNDAKSLQDSLDFAETDEDTTLHSSIAGEVTEVLQNFNNKLDFESTSTEEALAKSVEEVNLNESENESDMDNAVSDSLLIFHV
ncbi:unnamed protein product, partial [Protopolystoma xenopodis]